jgi:urea transporter
VVDSVVMAMPRAATVRHSAVIARDLPSVIVRHGHSVTVLPVVDSVVTVTAQAATSAVMVMPPAPSVTVPHVRASGATVLPSAAIGHHATTMHHAVTAVIAHDHASVHNLVLG